MKIGELIDRDPDPAGDRRGRYNLALMVDSGNALSEPNEDNNLIFSRQRSCSSASDRPDFTVVSVTPSQPTALPGGTLDVDLELRNAGNLEGASSWRVVLSGNSSPSVDDVIARSLRLGSIAGDRNDRHDQRDDRHPRGPDARTLLRRRGGRSGEHDPRSCSRSTTTASPSCRCRSDRACSRSRRSRSRWRISGSTTALRSPRRAVRASTSGRSQAARFPSGIALAADERRSDGHADGSGNLQRHVPRDQRNGDRDATLELVVAPIDGPLTIVTRRLLPGIVGSRLSAEHRRGAAAGRGRRLGDGDVHQHVELAAGIDARQRRLSPRSAHDCSGDFYIPIEASDGTNRASREIPLTIAEPGRLTLIGERLPSATFGDLYGYQLAVTGDNPVDPPIFSVVAGELPLGMMLSGQGEITGAPDAAGDFVFNVEVREAASGAKDTATFYLTVTTDEGLTIDPGSLPAATLNQPYEVVLVSGGWDVADSLGGRLLAGSPARTDGRARRARRVYALPDLRNTRRGSGERRRRDLGEGRGCSRTIAQGRVRPRGDGTDAAGEAGRRWLWVHRRRSA